MDVMDSVLLIAGFVILITHDSCLSEVYVKEAGQRIVEIKQGQVRGRVIGYPKDPTFKEVEEFAGIRYASLRGGRTRFMPPASVVRKWQYVHDASHVSEVCPQSRRPPSPRYPEGHREQIRRRMFHTNYSQEDCLTLNLYAPIQEKDNSSPFPVMVFIHGESYDIGTGNAYEGSVLASYGKVIVITVNYRLGVLGFLGTGHPNANGNQALLDLLAVLTWIKENIASFDGDPNRVTLFGHGHGAALVNFLLFVQTVKRENLFHRAILMSGSAGSSWSQSVDPLACAQKLAVNVNCSKYINESAKLIQCFKNKTTEELVNNAPIPPKYFSCFAPSTEIGTFFRGSLESMLRDKNSHAFSKIPVMFGVTKNEAYSYLKQEELIHGISEFRKTQILRTYVQNVFKYHRQKIFEILDHEYSDWTKLQDNKTRRDNVMEMISDGQYVAPIVKMAREHAETNAGTYFYSFGYSTNSESKNFPEWSSGVFGDELPYVFGAPLVDGISPFPSEYTKNEKRLSASIMRFWTNFAKSGNPNTPVKETIFEKDKFSDIEWPKYDLKKQQYLQIGKRPQVKHHYRGKQLATWLDLIPKINREDIKNGEKTDSAEHNLLDPRNDSTFDEPQRLITRFHRLFPAPPPTSPPPPKDTPYEPNTSSENVSENYEPKIFVTGGDNMATSILPPVSDSREAESLARSSVPLSITVAVGCSLLFLNILFFAGVYYQRDRIKKLKRAKGICETELRTPKKNGNNGADTNRQETSSLMTSQSVQQQNQLTPMKTVNERPEVQGNPIYAAISKSSDHSSDKYSYSPVPTDSSSPMHRHRDRNPHSHTNNVQSPYKGVSTFSSGRPPDRSPKADRNAYKNNDRLQSKSNKDNPSSNSSNAITVV
ncbi:neuroligin-2-like isoform X2 [Saccostrea echinata]|uniref:neuroligin-2-like isoform X2 n=1 Tax=Saccostrea echinata TaxID=191078 RepID=UPI002A809F70|nr:neuroligin-2-like isoform X2 [Saccostrea echinata]